MGKVPSLLRFADAGAVGPTQTSSMPPVPKVIFVSPGRTQLWPTRLACWSPTSALSIGAPGSAVAGAMGPEVSTSRGIIDREMRNTPSTVSFQSLASPSVSPVTAAFDRSVTWATPSVSTQAIQLSTVPKHRSRPRSGSRLSSSQASLVADWLGARARPWFALAMMQSNTVRRSCQPRPGPIGWPVARSHTTVEARCVLTPTACTGLPWRASASRATSSVTAAISAASNSTRPGAGLVGGRRR